MMVVMLGVVLGFSPHINPITGSFERKASRRFSGKSFQTQFSSLFFILCFLVKDIFKNNVRCLLSKLPIENHCEKILETNYS